MPAAVWFPIALFVLGIALLVIYTRTGKMIRCVLFTAVSGVAALGVVWLVGRMTAVALSITPFSLLTSAILGVPGVLTMLILNLF